MVGKVIRFLLGGGYNSTDDVDWRLDAPDYQIWKILKNRVYPSVGPQQNVASPYVIYRVEDNAIDTVKGTRSPQNNYKIELEIVSDTYADMNKLQVLLVEYLHRYSSSYNSSDSTKQGFGYPVNPTQNDNTYGAYCPPLTGDIKYVAGVQINGLEYISSVESYNENNFQYNSTMSFDLSYIDDLTVQGSDMFIKVSDGNLMSSNTGTGNLLYEQPAQINDGINYLFTPTVISESDNVNDNSLDGYYDVFSDPSGSSNTNRPLFKKSVLDPPYTYGQNYINWGTGKYLESIYSNRKDRRYKEATVFIVFKFPYLASPGGVVYHSSAALFRPSSQTDPSAMIGFTLMNNSNVLWKMQFMGVGIQETQAGVSQERSFNVGPGYLNWPGLLNPDLDFTKPMFVAVSMERNPQDPTKLRGSSDFVSSATFQSTQSGADDNDYDAWTDTAFTNCTWSEYPFCFSSLHSDVTNYSAAGGGWSSPYDFNQEMDLYDVVVWPEALEFGSNKYMNIKKQIIQKYGWYKS